MKLRKKAQKWYEKDSITISRMRAGSVHRESGYVWIIKARPHQGVGYIVERRGPMGKVLQRSQWVNFKTISEAREAIYEDKKELRREK